MYEAQDVYPWAGQLRAVRLAKDGSAFCYPEHISRELASLFRTLQDSRRLRGLSPAQFASQAAGFLASLNAIHPFREGYGRTQMLFLALLANRASHPLDLERLEPEPFLAAMVSSFRGDIASLIDQISHLIA